MMQSDISKHGFRVGLSNPADALSTCFSTSYTGIIAFMAVATEGSFARAGERLGVGRSAVCRNVQKLETQLCTRLFLRTTRSTRLTREGERFFENCNRGVAHIVEAMNDMLELRQGPPRGLLRISAPVDFGRKVVAPLLSRFAEAYPDIAVDLMLDERPADFAGAQIDVAFRSGRIEDSSIIAKRLAPMRTVLCASRAYAERRGLPSTLEELSEHECINFRYPGGRVSEWEFKVDGHVRKHLPAARLTFNDADLVLQAVLDGRGIAQMAGYQIRDPLARHALVMALPRYMPDDSAHYICYLCRQHLPRRIRVFIDFATEKIRTLDRDDLAGFHSVDPQDAAQKLAA
ncbi:LysR family transcriptional regulator [Cupriavidus consociatus]|uniref:LysR family transcriptional regulator n=1 Tax=Cupriavidus consociatus TaxID=2821357 RepID=UPI001AEA65E6|nr:MULTISPECIES: LysR family transcriptional regulator [unclassified Cupriavidus]MBP0624034.1 LysR family transcriptional regulator [Cupriavidus sp. LEh25]MDK2660744.1 LysR substrate-binding domain-containing protein [Cupriavidus sp. LEh21]